MYLYTWTSEQEDLGLTAGGITSQPSSVRKSTQLLGASKSTPAERVTHKCFPGLLGGSGELIYENVLYTLELKKSVPKLL